jgi:hypothetical protein
LNAGGNGCFDADSDAPGVREGAAYDPASDSWRRIADAPVPIGVYDTAAWVGDVALFATQFTQRLLAYDPATDRWSERSTEVLPTGFGRHAAIGDRWVSIASDDLSGQPDMAYDPATDRWSDLPDDPIGPSTGRFVVPNGSNLVLVAKPPGATVQNPLPTRLAVFDPATSTWTRLPDSPITSFGVPWYDAGPGAVATWLFDADGNAVAALPESGIVDRRTAAPAGASPGRATVARATPRGSPRPRRTPSTGSPRLRGARRSAVWTWRSGPGPSWSAGAAPAPEPNRSSRRRAWPTGLHRRDR